MVCWGEQIPENFFFLFGGFTRYDSAFNVRWSSIYVLGWWGTECAGGLPPTKPTDTWTQWDSKPHPAHLQADILPLDAFIPPIIQYSRYLTPVGLRWSVTMIMSCHVQLMFTISMLL